MINFFLFFLEALLFTRSKMMADFVKVSTEAKIYLPELPIEIIQAWIKKYKLEEDPCIKISEGGRILEHQRHCPCTRRRRK
jgi:hypothetical protein